MYKVTAAQADDTVVLVDNVRDANYYDPTSPDGQTFIGGFFYSLFNFYANRNIMTIDAYDWLHRTGATAPDDTANPAVPPPRKKKGGKAPTGPTPTQLVRQAIAQHKNQ